MPPWLSLTNILLILGSIDTVVIGILATLYFRKLGGEVAEARLRTLHTNHIAAAESYIALLKVEIADLKARLKTALELVHRADVVLKAEGQRLKRYGS